MCLSFLSSFFSPSFLRLLFSFDVHRALYVSLHLPFPSTSLIYDSSVQCYCFPIPNSRDAFDPLFSFLLSLRDRVYDNSLRFSVGYISQRFRTNAHFQHSQPLSLLSLTLSHRAIPPQYSRSRSISTLIFAFTHHILTLAYGCRPLVRCSPTCIHWTIGPFTPFGSCVSSFVWFCFRISSHPCCSPPLMSCSFRTYGCQMLYLLICA